MTDPSSDFRAMTADIVSAYVGSRNHVQPAELPNLISAVHAALSGLAGGPEAEPTKLEPAVPIRKAVTPDAITCLACGKKFKALKRHLRVDHDQTPAEYRAQWGLPATFPMVAPNYASARSALARAMGLGQGGRDGSPAAAGVAAGSVRDAPPPAPDVVEVAPPKRRGRPPKAS
ncbi:MAG: MucR family transcriptional regulator [Proteobacteria bacterium]|nr:MucR family transcriptional regulator [Pseudomonadota bacterium]